MHIDKLTKELGAKGIQARLEDISIMKNSVLCTGIRVVDPEHPEISPVVYYSSDETAEAILERIMTVISQPKPDFCMKRVCDRDYLMSHIYLAASRRDGERDGILVKPWLNLDLILKVAVAFDSDGQETGTVKVNRELLDAAGINEEGAWTQAFANTGDTVTFDNIAAVFGIAEEDLSIPMFIARANHNADGSAAIAFPDAFGRFCRENSLDALYILPSSTQELIVIPAAEAPSEKEMVLMVEEINHTCVDPLIQLDPVVYRYLPEDNTLQVVTDLGEEA